MRNDCEVLRRRGTKYSLGISAVQSSSAEFMVPMAVHSYPEVSGVADAQRRCADRNTACGATVQHFQLRWHCAHEKRRGTRSILRAASLPLGAKLRALLTSNICLDGVPPVCCCRLRRAGAAAYAATAAAAAATP